MMPLRIRQRVAALLAQFPGGSQRRPGNLLPARRPVLAELRPGWQHCQIHDPHYLQQILMAEQEANHVQAKEEPRKAS